MIGGKKVLESFPDSATLGMVLDGISKLLLGAQQVWYRGEAKHYAQPALPVLGRTSGVDLTPIEGPFVQGSDSFPLRVITNGERAFVEKVQGARPPDPYFYKLVASDVDPAWLALARHHGYPTRLLDVTRDLRVALYFACHEHPDEDAFVLAYVNPYNPDRAPPAHYADLFDPALGDMIPTYRETDRRTPGTLAAHAARLSKSIPVSRAGMAYLFECTVALNDRMNAQRGGFLWRGDPSKNLLDGTDAFPFRISKLAKSGIIQQLDLHGINKVSLRI